MKLLIAGNKNYGLAKSLYELYPNATFLSRSTGYDLSKNNIISTVKEMSIEYDVFISVSCLYQYKQTLLVEAVASKWINTNHNGYIIAIGSSADTPVKGTCSSYPAEKKSLRAYMRQLSQIASSDIPQNWKSTYLSPGHIHTPKQDKKLPDTPKLNPSYISEVIAWLLNQPNDINISELCLDKIQFNNTDSQEV